MKKRIVVIGAGFGGLTAAALLSQAGHTVTLLEQGDWIGGKSRRLKINNQIIDSGPSLVTFSQVWQKVLDKYMALGGAVENPPSFIRLAEVGKYFFQGETITLPIPSDHPWFSAWERFVAEHAGLERPIADLLTSHPTDIKALSSVFALLRVYGFRLNTQKYLDSQDYLPEGLKELIAIHTLNAGVSPNQTLPIYASVTAIMASQGILVPAGGVNELPKYLAKLAMQAGCEIVPNSQVTEIHKGRVLANGKTHECDIVVSGLDADRTFELVSGVSPDRDPNRSCSGVAIYAVLDKALPVETVTHSVVMPDQPRDLYQKLQRNQRPEQTMAFVNYYKPNEIYRNSEPTVAVLLTAAADGQVADLQTPWVAKELERISKVMGLGTRIDNLFESFEILHPSYFASIGGPLGAIYGKRNPLWKSGPFHSPKYRSIFRPWLYLVGSSVHPGGGMPAVMGGAMNSIRGLL
jgi:phytoene desaturase